MERRVLFTEESVKFLIKLSKGRGRDYSLNLRRDIERLLLDYERYASRIRKIKGYSDLWRLSIREFRVVFTREGADVIVLYIGERKNVYKRLGRRK